MTLKIDQSEMDGRGSVYPQSGTELKLRVQPIPPTRNGQLTEHTRAFIVALGDGGTNHIHTGQATPVNGGIMQGEYEIVEIRPGQRKRVSFANPEFNMTLTGK